MSKEDNVMMRKALENISIGMGTDDDYATLDGCEMFYNISKSRKLNPTSWSIGADALEEQKRSEMRENDPYFNEFEELESKLHELMDRLNYAPTKYAEDNTWYWNAIIREEIKNENN